MEELMPFAAGPQPIRKVYDLTLDLKRQSNIELKGIVSGDNGTVFRITLTNGGADIPDADIDECRVIMYVRSTLGWRSQDSLTEDSDVEIHGGVITIRLHEASYAAGQNLVRLEVYSKNEGSDAFDTLVTTQSFSFQANAGTSGADAIETSDTWPALIDAIEKANRAADGVVSIARVTVNDNGHLVVHYTNGRTADVGALNTVGAEPDHLLKTIEGGQVIAGNRLLFGSAVPDAVDFEDGDIYVRELGGWGNLTAEATTLPSTSRAMAAFNEDSGVFSFGIPAGQTGAKGDKGDSYTITDADYAAIATRAAARVTKEMIGFVVGGTDPEQVDVPEGTLYIYVPGYEG